MAIALISIVAVGLGAWATLIKDAVSREEAVEIVATHSPYREDRAVIREKLFELDKRTERIDVKVDDLRTEQTRLIERVERVLERNP